jgi:hypothetical protein
VWGRFVHVWPESREQLTILGRVVIKPGHDGWPLLFHDDALKEINQVINSVTLGHCLERRAIAGFQRGF